MRLASVLALAALAACAGRAPPARAPADLATESYAVPEIPDEWRGPSVDVSQPVPVGGGRAAVLLARRSGDLHEVAVAVGRRERPAELVPLASIDVAGSRRDVLSTLSTFLLDGARLLRVDVRVFENVEPRFFAVRTLLVAAPAGEPPRVVLDRLVESGNDFRDRTATISARDVDGDGAQELVVVERESGNPARRTLIYRSDAGGRLITDGVSLFAR